MSYCRKSDDSDLYVVKTSVDPEEWTCYGCPLFGSREGNRAIATLIELRNHLDIHTYRGHKVPDRVYTRIDQELKMEREGHERVIDGPLRLPVRVEKIITLICEGGGGCTEGDHPAEYLVPAITDDEWAGWWIAVCYGALRRHNQRLDHKGYANSVYHLKKVGS